MVVIILQIGVLWERDHKSAGRRISLTMFIQIFWAVDPSDMPDSLRSNVEETVLDDTSGINTCAIIR